MLRRSLALIALFAFAVSVALPVETRALIIRQQDPKQPDPKQPEPKQQEPKQRDTKQDSKQSETKFTAEQVVESVILIYGTRPALEQIRRNGVERGRITRYTTEGNTEETSYERRFIRGESLDKDKIRLDQKLPTMEYSLIFIGQVNDEQIETFCLFSTYQRQRRAALFIAQQRIDTVAVLREETRHRILPRRKCRAVD